MKQRTGDQLAKLTRRLDRIPKTIRTAVHPALDRSSTELVSRIESLAPVDEGDLRDSAEVRKGDHELQRIVTVGDEAAFYARWVEFGAPHSPAQPYFYPAYRLLRRKIENRIKRAIGKAVREEWTR